MLKEMLKKLNWVNFKLNVEVSNSTLTSAFSIQNSALPRADS